MNFQSDYPLTYLSLFSGIGGFEVGIHTIYPNAQCLGYSEIDPHALTVYKDHFPDHINLGDVTKIDARKFRGRVDLLVGGSPCQSFSNMGKRKGMKGKSKLVKEYVRILQECQPRYFILENVVMKQEFQDPISLMLGESLARYDKGSKFITDTGDELRLEPVMIDSNVTSHQRRRRLYWCNFDISHISNLPFMAGTVGEILLDPNDIRLREVIWKDLSKRLTGSTDKKIRDIILKDYYDRFIEVIRYDSVYVRTLCASGYSNRYVRMSHGIVRNMHPIEWERLQTFPDDWTKSIPKTRRTKALGNAVTCEVIALIVSMIPRDPEL